MSSKHDVYRGLLHISSSSLVAKIVSLLAQWVLGYVLLKDDFALFAAATSIQLVVAGLREGGVGRLLVQSNVHFSLLARSAIAYGVAVSVIGVLLIALISPFYAKHANLPGLPVIASSLAICMPFQAVTSVWQAKLRVEGRFREIAAFEAKSAIAQSVVTVAGAATGFGVMAFVFGTVAATLMSLFQYYPRCTVDWKPPRWRLIKIVAFRTRWIILLAFATALALKGDYFALGLTASPEILAVYFFGYQLASSLSTVVTTAFNTVLLPSFSKLDTTTGGGRSYVKNTTWKLYVGSIPLFSLGCILGPEVIHILWSGKWDASAVVFQCVLLSTSLKLLAAATGIALEAQGRWAERTAMISVDGVVSTVAIGIAGFSANIPLLAWIAALARAVISVGQVAWAGVRMQMDWKTTVIKAIGLFLLSGAAVVLILMTSAWLDRLLALEALGSLLLKSGIAIFSGCGVALIVKVRLKRLFSV